MSATVKPETFSTPIPGFNFPLAMGEHAADSVRLSTPEQRLMLQVLMLALSDAYVGDSESNLKREQICCDALEWIMSDGEGPMSCRTICDALGLEIGLLRRQVARSMPVRYRHATG